MNRQGDGLPGVFEEARLRLERQVAALKRPAIGGGDLSRAERASIAWRVLTLALFDVATESEIAGLAAWSMAEEREGMDRLFARLAERGETRALDAFIAAVEGIEGRPASEAEALDQFLRDTLSPLRAVALDDEQAMQAGWFFTDPDTEDSIDALRRHVDALDGEMDRVVGAFVDALARGAELGPFRLLALGHALAVGEPLGRIVETTDSQWTSDLRTDAVTLARDSLRDYAADQARERAVERLERSAEVLRLGQLCAGLIDADFQARTCRELLDAAGALLADDAESRRRARALGRMVEAMADRQAQSRNPDAIGAAQRQGWVRLHAEMDQADARALDVALRVATGAEALVSPSATTALVAPRARAELARRLVAASDLIPGLKAAAELEHRQAGARLSNLLREVGEREGAALAIDDFMRDWESHFTQGKAEAAVGRTRERGTGALGALERDRKAYLVASGQNEDVRTERARIELDLRLVRALAASESMRDMTGQEAALSRWGAWRIPEGLIGRLASDANELAKEAEGLLVREEREAAARVLDVFQLDLAEALLIRLLAKRVLPRVEGWTGGAPGVIAALSAPPGAGVWMLEERTVLARISIGWASRDWVRRGPAPWRAEEASEFINDLARGVLSRFQRAEGA